MNIRIFKYLPEEHKKSVLNTGSISIGTIEHYREKEKDKRGDPTEGKYTFWIYPKKGETITLTNKEANSISYDYLLKDRGLCIGEQTHFRDKLEVPNVFVFCASTIQSENLNKFGEAVYEILNIRSFGNMIYNKLNEYQPIITWMAKPVEYVKTKFIRVTNENKKQVLPCYTQDYAEVPGFNTIQLKDYFVKTNDFKLGSEFRFIFIPRGKPVFSQKIINVPEINKVIQMK